MKLSRNMVVNLVRMSVLRKPIRLIIKLIKMIFKVLGLNKLKKEYGIFLNEKEQFFQTLNKHRIEYVVLRWFDNLTNLKEGDDIDILVSDLDYYNIRKYMRKERLDKPGFIKIDLYPESNQSGHISYYPPNLARRILDGRRVTDNGIWVPNDMDYFFSLSYHVLFHKGFKSGLRSKYDTNGKSISKRNYAQYLTELGKKVGIILNEITMESLEDLLGKHDWLPPLDVYFRRAPLNDWVEFRANAHVEPNWRKNRGLAVFILREKISTPEMMDKIERLLFQDEVSILKKIELTSEEAAVFALKTRGGDWVKKMTELAYGGLPKVVYIVQKRSDFRSQEEEIPKGVVMYDWLLKIKKEIRDEYIKSVRFHEKCHVIHTSDNGVEASYYIKVLEGILEQSLLSRPD